MIFYSLPEVLAMLLAAIALDWWIGDPRWMSHPVIVIGNGIRFLEKRLMNGKAERAKGVALTVTVTAASFAATGLICAAAQWLHPWLGYAAHTWLISTTIAVKGLKEAAMLVYEPLRNGDPVKARENVGHIVGRDTDGLDESGVSRASVETVAENTVDAFVSPLVYALLGAAPLAMLYRAANTLDSMVGYKNEKYRRFGWASARWDDVMNYIPARLTGLLLTIVCLLKRGVSAAEAVKAMLKFAPLHLSPNSGIPESAVAGALGIELGGTNFYGGVASERARMGWPKRPLDRNDIIRAVELLYGVSYLIAGGLLCVLLALLL